MHSHVTDCLAKGANVLTGGTAEASLNAAGGSFYLPTILSDCNSDMHPFTDETFGPVLPFLKFSDDDEAIRIANDTR